jgi:hypothetical protein
MRIFRHGFNGDPAHFVQRSTSQYGTRTAEEGRIPHIVAVLQQTIEQSAFIRRAAETTKVTFKRIGGEKVVRRLHHAELFVFKEPAQR